MPGSSVDESTANSRARYKRNRGGFQNRNLRVFVVPVVGAPGRRCSQRKDALAVGTGGLQGGEELKTANPQRNHFGDGPAARNVIGL